MTENSDNVAIVTGGASGIGLGIAQTFAARGYRVVIADISADDAASRAATLGAGHLGVGVDVANEGNVLSMMAAVRSRFGRLDALVNNAGIGDTHLPTLEQSVEQFRRVMDVHVTGTYLVSREAARLMAERSSGAIVNISSIAGMKGMPKRNAYSAAKAGIVAMTEAMACEWASLGIRVNAIAPGYVETELVGRLIAAGRIDRNRMIARIPAGRLGQPDDIAKAAAFLCSPDADYIYGACLNVDGGWNAFNDAGPAHVIP